VLAITDEPSTAPNTCRSSRLLLFRPHSTETFPESLVRLTLALVDAFKTSRHPHGVEGGEVSTSCTLKFDCHMRLEYVTGLNSVGTGKNTSGCWTSVVIEKEAKCVLCGSPTQLYCSGTPLCVKCSESTAERLKLQLTKEPTRRSAADKANTCVGKCDSKVHLSQARIFREPL
jgi:hypothetical protein